MVFAESGFDHIYHGRQPHIFCQNSYLQHFLTYIAHFRKHLYIQSTFLQISPISLTFVQLALVLSQLGHLTLYSVKSYPKMSHLLKKLAFTDVYILDGQYQVTLLLDSTFFFTNICSYIKNLSFRPIFEVPNCLHLYQALVS